jgi:hypothetical protein
MSAYASELAASRDVLEVPQDRLGRRDGLGAEMPLQIAEPDDEFGDGRRAGVEFEADELMRINSRPVEPKPLLPAQIGERF